MRSNADRGFTLIEVLAALIIVAIGMLAVIKGVSETVRNASYLREKTLAHWIAMNRLAEVRLAGRVPEVAKSDGDVEFAGQKWRWKMNVTQTAVQTMRRIDINVRKDGMPDKTSLAAITGFYGSAVERPGLISTTQVFTPGAVNGQEGDSAGSASGGSVDNNPSTPRTPQPRPQPQNEPPDLPTAPVPPPGSEPGEEE